MHISDPKVPPDQPDKRSAIPIELADVDQCLAGGQDEARELLRVARAEVFDTGPI
jgi:hypothetical protein